MSRFNDPSFFPRMFRTFVVQTFRIVTVPITAEMVAPTIGMSAISVTIALIMGA